MTLERELARIPDELNTTLSDDETNARAAGQVFGGGLYRRAVEDWTRLYVGDEELVCWRHGLLGVRGLAEALHAGTQESAALVMLDDGQPRLTRLHFAGVYHSMACIHSAIIDTTAVIPPSLWACQRASASELEGHLRSLASSLAQSTDRVFGGMVSIDVPDSIGGEF